MKDSTILHIVAIASITAIELTAIIVMHADGVLLSFTVAAISGLAGYTVGRRNGGSINSVVGKRY